jgi:hypothetical protein
MSDFHVLLYLYGLNCFDIKMKTQMSELLEAVRKGDEDLANKFMRGDTWRTFEQLISAHEHEYEIYNIIFIEVIIFFFS